MVHSLNLQQLIERCGDGRKIEQIAASANIGKSTLYAYINAEVDRPKPWILMAIAHALGKPYASVYQAAQRTLEQARQARDPSVQIDRTKAVLGDQEDTKGNPLGEVPQRKAKRSVSPQSP